MRWLVLHDLPDSDVTQQRLKDFPAFLDDKSIEMAAEFPKGSSKREETFHKSFRLLNSFGENVFRKWDVERLEFRGPFLNTAFEVIGMGLGFLIANKRPYRTDIEAVVKGILGSNGERIRHGTLN